MKRRRLLKAAGTFGLAGALAGCEETTFEDENDAETTLPPIETVTTLDITTIGDIEESGGCEAVVEPTADDGECTLWHGRAEAGTQLLRGTQALFNQRYDPTVNLARVPSRSFLAKLRSAIPAGKGPHAFLWAHDVAGEFLSNNFLADQSGALRVDPCAYTETAWEAAHYQGQTIGLPWAAESPALIYNADILDELGVDVPETFDEWLAVMDQYHDPSNGRYGLAMPVNAYFSSWAAQTFGAEIYDDETDELGLESDALVEGVNLLLEDLKPYMPGDPAYSAQVAVFQDGNAPFTINGPWTTAGLNHADFEWGVSTIPAPSGGTPRPYMGVKLVYFAKKMRQDAQATTAARQFAEWYTTSDERLVNLANQVGFVPVKTGLAGNEQLPETVQGFAEQIQSGYPMPQDPKMNAVWTPYENAILEAFTSGNDVEPLLADAAQTVRQSDSW